MIGTTRQRMAVAAAAALVAGPLAAAAPAFADDGGHGGGHGGGGSVVEARGTCTNGAHWDLKAKHNDGRIELEFEVDTNRAGQVWAVRRDGPDRCTERFLHGPRDHRRPARGRPHPRPCDARHGGVLGRGRAGLTDALPVSAAPAGLREPPCGRCAHCRGY